MQPSPGSHAVQQGLRAWLSERSIKHAWAARKLGYTEAYFSRVINGKDRLTDQFRGRCQVRLGCPGDVWTEN
jgi:plasmid maintenance system antidote protein VapI